MNKYGIGGFRKGYDSRRKSPFVKGHKIRVPPESRIAAGIKISKLRKGMKFSEKHKKNISISHKGLHCSPKTEFKKGHIVNFKTGKQKRCGGYIAIYSPKHPFAKNNRVFEHRLVMEKTLNRYLEPIEVVHHINGIVDDNRPENLKLFPNSASHMVYHRLSK